MSDFSTQLFNALDHIGTHKVDGKTQLVNTSKFIELSSRSSDVIRTMYEGRWDENEVPFGLFDGPKKDVFGNDIEVLYKIGAFQFNQKTAAKMITDYSKFSTKEFWNYLHSEWKFCDVITHSNGNSLEAYMKIKGNSYNAFIRNHLNVELLSGKRILEIGPGYGIFPKFLNENGIKSKYWCLDIVKRFDHDNFVVGNGMIFPIELNEKFDIVFMLDAFGHIPAEAMENYITTCISLLSDDGKILINTTPKEGWCFFFGTITKGLTLDELQKIVDDAGFEMSKEKFFITDTFTEADITTISRKKPS